LLKTQCFVWCAGLLHCGAVGCVRCLLRSNLPQLECGVEACAVRSVDGATRNHAAGSGVTPRHGR
jgi:hypothetical protein